MNRIRPSFGTYVAYSGWAIAVAGLALLVGGGLIGYFDAWRLAALFMSSGIALGVAGVPKLSGFQFTAWIVAAVCTAMIYPDYCLRWRSGESSWDLTHPWLLLAIIQVVMFGMGTQMSLRDFAGVARMPQAVMVGLFCQFTIMPLLGYAIAKSLRFPDEVAAGVILIGSCSSGLASNVMVYLARGNVALSITLTSVATLISPLVTPLWMRYLANELVETSLTKMMLNTFKIVVVPLVAAFLSDYLLRASARVRRWAGGLATACAVGLWGVQSGWWAKAVTGLGDYAGWMDVLAFLMGSVVAGFLYFVIASRRPTIREWMPRLSMIGIVYFVLVTTAKGRDNLLAVGILLIVAAALHNCGGYVLGYWFSRLLGLDRISARTVAFEVGLQNGGMAVSLAAMMGKLSTVGLAPIVFSPWMNLSGSVLANYWRRTVPPCDDRPDQ